MQPYQHKSRRHQLNNTNHSEKTKIMNRNQLQNKLCEMENKVKIIFSKYATLKQQNKKKDQQINQLRLQNNILKQKCQNLQKSIQNQKRIQQSSFQPINTQKIKQNSDVIQNTNNYEKNCLNDRVKDTIKEIQKSSQFFDFQKNYEETLSNDQKQNRIAELRKKYDLQMNTKTKNHKKLQKEQIKILGKEKLKLIQEQYKKIQQKPNQQKKESHILRHSKSANPKFFKKMIDTEQSDEVEKKMLQIKENKKRSTNNSQILSQYKEEDNQSLLLSQRKRPDSSEVSKFVYNDTPEFKRQRHTASPHCLYKNDDFQQSTVRPIHKGKLSKSRSREAQALILRQIWQQRDRQIQRMNHLFSSLDERLYQKV